MLNEKSFGRDPFRSLPALGKPCPQPRLLRGRAVAGTDVHTFCGNLHGRRASRSLSNSVPLRCGSRTHALRRECPSQVSQVSARSLLPASPTVAALPCPLCGPSRQRHRAQRRCTPCFMRRSSFPREQKRTRTTSGRRCCSRGARSRRTQCALREQSLPKG